MGYRAVGKSSLAVQFVQGQFVDYYETTIENAFKKTISVKGSQYELSLVDTGHSFLKSFISHDLFQKISLLN